MRFLLDTNVLLYALSDDARLKPFRGTLLPSAHDVYYSAVSVAEISIKSSAGKLVIPETYLDAVRQQGFIELPLTAAHSRATRALPWHHRDPFDRLLIAQALVEDLQVMTTDRQFDAYDIRLFKSS
jgi:PIN domain nuclease of toxin-antitoxin system